MARCVTEQHAEEWKNVQKAKSVLDTKKIGKVMILTEDKLEQIYRTIILPVVLYGCETWSLALREERRLTVF